jgi:hypothetical protein
METHPELGLEKDAGAEWARETEQLLPQQEERGDEKGPTRPNNRCHELFVSLVS